MRILLFLLLSLVFFSFKINTSNPGKLKEFERLFAKYGVELEASRVDLEEIDADALTVVVHKASQLDGVLIEDTSLAIEGEDVGVNIRWLIGNLDLYVGKRAVCTVYLAYHLDGKVFVCKGEVFGTIVNSRGGGGFGFDPYFLPDGASKTLAEEKPDCYNARALAVDAFMLGKFAVHPAIYEWEGSWQKH